MKRKQQSKRNRSEELARKIADKLHKIHATPYSGGVSREYSGRVIYNYVSEPQPIRLPSWMQ